MKFNLFPFHKILYYKFYVCLTLHKFILVTLLFDLYCNEKDILSDDRNNLLINFYSNY